MSDDIDVGIKVSSNDADIARAERAAQSVRAFTITVEQSREIMARVGGDFGKFKDELLKLKEAHDAASASGKSFASAETQVGQAAQQAGANVGGAANRFVQFGNASDAAFQRVPRGARTAANALSQITIAIETGSGSMTSMIRAAGGLGFGLAQLSSNANIVAGAAGIGALITVGATIIEVFARMDDQFDKTRARQTNFAEFSVHQLEVIQGAQRRFADEQQKAAAKAAAPPTVTDVLKGIGDPLANFRIIGRGLGLIGQDAQKVFQNAIKNVEDAQTALVNKSREENRQFREDQTKTAEQIAETTIKRLGTEAEARKRAARNELDDEIRAIRDKHLAEDRTNAEIQSKTALFNERVRQIDKDQSDAELKLKDEQAKKLAAIDDKSVQGEIGKRRAAVQAEFDDELRAINQRKDISAGAREGARVRAAEIRTKAIRAIDVDEALASKKVVEEAETEILAAESRSNDDRIGIEVAAAKKRLDVASEELKTKGVKDDAFLRARLAALLAFNADVAAATKKENDDLDKAVAESRARSLELQGKPAQAEQARAAAETATLIGRLQAAAVRGRPNANAEIDQIRRQGELAVAAGRVKEIEQSVTDALDHEQARLNEIHALLVTHTISEREARLEIVDAETKARDAIAASIPLLQAQADKLQDTKSADQVLALKTRLLELDLAIRQNSDDLFKLKETGIDSATSALAGIFEGATKLGTQSRVEINSLRQEIANAQDELTTLLERPSRSPTDNQRITQLRGEIQQTTVALDNARHAITTWKDLFVNAAQSIVDALIKVSSQMLATAAIERILGFLSGLGSGNAIDDILSQGIPGVQVTPGRAAGGLIRGPGTPTSDSVLTPTSDGEYVVRASRVRQFGESFFDRINFDGEIPPLPVRRRGYAGGGLVEASPPVTTMRRSEPKAVVHHFLLTAPPGFEVKHLDSPPGHAVVVKIISERANAVNAALGR